MKLTLAAEKKSFSLAQFTTVLCTFCFRLAVLRQLKISRKTGRELNSSNCHRWSSFLFKLSFLSHVTRFHCIGIGAPQSGLKRHIKTIRSLPPERIKENRDALRHMWATFASETIANSPNISILLLLLIVIIIVVFNIDLDIDTVYARIYFQVMGALAVMSPLLNALSVSLFSPPYRRAIASHLSSSLWSSQRQTIVQPFA